MFIARDKNGGLTLFNSKPIRDNESGFWCQADDCICSTIDLDTNLFPDLKWEDEPKEVFLNTGYDMALQINNVWGILKCTQDELAKSNEYLGMYSEKFETLKKVLLYE